MIDQCLADRASNLNLNTLPGISNVFPSVESRAPFVPSVSAATTVTSILNAAPVATSSLNASAAPFVPQFYRRRSSSELSDRSSSRDVSKYKSFNVYIFINSNFNVFHFIKNYKIHLVVISFYCNAWF